jgi:signal transduction histidine kinase
MKEALALEAIFAEELCDAAMPAQIQLNTPQIQLTNAQQTVRRSADHLQAHGFMRSSIPAALNQTNPILTSSVFDVELIRRQERERIERDLHDELGGNLIALKMLIELADKQISSDVIFNQQRMLWHRLIDQAIDSIHRITSDLQPAALSAGLPAALAWLVNEQSQQSSTTFQLHQHVSNIDIEPTLATALFRVAQESCNNIRKHAKASQVDLYLLYTDGTLILEVIDNGVGFEIDQPTRSACVGLRGMRERIVLLSGEFYIASSPGKGTLVRATLPAEYQSYPEA